MKPKIFFLILLVVLPLALAEPIVESTSEITANVEGDTTTDTSSGSSGSSSGGSSGGGGSSGSGVNCNMELWIDSENCKDYVCPRYIEQNDCTTEYHSQHLCCVRYFEAPVEESEFEESLNKLLEEQESIIDSIQEDNLTEEIQDYDRKYNLIPFFAIVLGGVILFLLYRIYVVIKKPKVEEDLTELRAYIEQEREAGTTSPTLKKVLIANGWDSKIINREVNNLYGNKRLKR